MKCGIIVACHASSRPSIRSPSVSALPASTQPRERSDRQSLRQRNFLRLVYRSRGKNNILPFFLHLGSLLILLSVDGGEVDGKSGGCEMQYNSRRRQHKNAIRALKERERKKGENPFGLIFPCSSLRSEPFRGFLFPLFLLISLLPKTGKKGDTTNKNAIRMEEPKRKN